MFAHQLHEETYHATYQKDKYPQMMAWLEWHKKIQRHSILIKQQQQCHPMHTLTSIPTGLLKISVQYLKMACNPTVRATFGELATKYSVIDFQDALANFIANYPGASAVMLCTWAADMLISFSQFPSSIELNSPSLVTILKTQRS